MSTIEIIQLLVILSILFCGCLCFFYNLWRMSKSFKFMGTVNILIASFLLSLVWPLIIFYYCLVHYMEKHQLK